MEVIYKSKLRTVCIISMLSLFLFSSCKKESKEKTNDLQIVFGSSCGWCVGTDSLVVVNNKITYNNVPACNNPGYSKERILKADEWQELMTLLDKEKIKSINLSTCNRCADGCDTLLVVKSEGYYHRITYGAQDDGTIQPIRPLIDKLTVILKGIK